MGKRMLKPGHVEQILALRAQLDGWGEPELTGTEIAARMGVSESTVWRVIRGQAAYKQTKKEEQQAAINKGWAALNAAGTTLPMPDLTGSSITDAVIAASLAKVMAKLDVKEPTLDEVAKARLARYLGKD